MRTVKLLVDIMGKKAGDVVEVENNTAHTLIDTKKGILVIRDLLPEEDKMMKPKTKRGKKRSRIWH